MLEEENENKNIIISKYIDSTQNIISSFGYIGLFGNKIEKSIEKTLEKVPKDYQNNQIKRDGNKHHITILIKNEFENCIENLKKIDKYNNILLEKCKENSTPIEKIMNVLEEVLEDDWENIGLGRIIKNEEETYFNVIEWKSAAKFLKDVEIDRDFHITVLCF
jgi:hypothetical protein